MTHASRKAPSPIPEPVRRAFTERPPGRLMGPGHPIGDWLGAPGWELLEESDGRLRLRCHVPPNVLNPRGHLFGGFTPTYVDLIALCTARAGRPQDAPRGWLATLQMRVDYFEPIAADFLVDSQVVHRRGANAWVETRFSDEGGKLLALAHTTLREAREP